MAQQIARFCTVCGGAAAPRALFCVECGARLVGVAAHRRAPRPPGAFLGGRYRVRRLISMGGNGVVYEAQHTSLGTLHALKETLAGDPAALAQFLAEARLLASLAHPALVRVTDFFTEPDAATFLVMDYVPGETLQHKLDRPGSYTLSDAIRWILQICAALEYLHDYHEPSSGQRRPIIHRDIKPLNVALTPEGQIKLLDLGIARVLVPGQETARVARAVSEPFAPIEQYGAGTDARSDQYALGVTSYALLTRRLPPSAPERIAQPQELRVRALNRQVPPGVAAAIERAMMLRPEARYPSVAAFRRAVEIGWIGGDRADLPGAGNAPDPPGLWSTIRRVFGGGAQSSPPVAPAENFTLAERLVEWRSGQDRNAALEVIVVLERGADGPSRLRMAATLMNRGPRGRAALQQIVIEEAETRDFAARLAELPRLRGRLTAELTYTVDSTTLHGTWRGGSGPLDLSIRTRGPRGGLRSCTIALDRRQVEALAAELQHGLRRVPPR